MPAKKNKKHKSRTTTKAKPRNPKGRAGDLLSLSPLDFEDAVRGLLKVIPERPKQPSVDHSATSSKAN